MSQNWPKNFRFQSPCHIFMTVHLLWHKEWHITISIRFWRHAHVIRTCFVGCNRCNICYSQSQKWRSLSSILIHSSPSRSYSRNDVLISLLVYVHMCVCVWVCYLYLYLSLCVYMYPFICILYERSNLLTIQELYHCESLSVVTS